MTAPRLELKNISHSFFGVPVNKDISLTVNPGEVLGLIGENGAGKSTLANIIGGLIRPDQGEQFVDGDLYAPSSPGSARKSGIAIVHQELNLFSELSVLDNIFLTSYPRRFGIFTDRKSAQRETVRALKLLDLPFAPSATVEEISPGNRQMLEIAKAIVGSPSVIILDEPTTSLTSRETEKLFALIRELKQTGMSFIYVSHILEDIMALSDRIAVMRDGSLVDVRPKSESSIPELITMMVGRSIDNLYPSRESEPSDSTVLTLDSVSATGLVQDISLSVNAGEVVGIFGLMGAGRTELARVIYGLEPIDTGRITLLGTDITHMATRDRIPVGLSFVTEDRRNEGLFMSFPVVTNVSLPSLRRWAKNLLAPLRRSSILGRVAAVAKDLTLKASNLDESPVHSLSGGNQQKVVLAKWLLTHPKLLILDEPTRGVDVGARFEVYRAVLNQADSGMGILMISSDLSELLGTCNRILVMRMGRVVANFTSSEFNSRRILGSAFGERENNTSGGLS